MPHACTCPNLLQRHYLYTTVTTLLTQGTWAATGYSRFVRLLSVVCWWFLSLLTWMPKGCICSLNINIYFWAKAVTFELARCLQKCMLPSLQHVRLIKGTLWPPQQQCRSQKPTSVLNFSIVIALLSFRSLFIIHIIIITIIILITSLLLQPHF